MKQVFETPQLEIIEIDETDIIATSDPIVKTDDM